MRLAHSSDSWTSFGSSLGRWGIYRLYYHNYVNCYYDYYRNLGRLAEIMRRHSSPVDTGMVLVQSSSYVTGGIGETILQFASGVFFTRVHFDIFGLFFPRDVSALDSATKLLIDVYEAQNLTLCVSETAVSSSASSSSFNSHCYGVSSRSPDTKENWTKIYEQELATLLR